MPKTHTASKRSLLRDVFVAALTGLALMVPLSSMAAAADKPAVYLKKGDVAALGGHDPVSYFRGNGVPQPGSASFAATHQGVTYHFASAANREAFKAAPARYLPQYGGYCAFAVAKNATASGDPQQYAVVGGKLYLNYNADVQAKFNKDQAGFIAKADANWPTVLTKGGLF